MSKANINFSNFNSNSNHAQSSRVSGVTSKKTLQPNNYRDKPFTEYRNGIEPKKLTKNQSFTEKRGGIIKKDRLSSDENFNPLFKQPSGVQLGQNQVDNRNLTTMIESSRNFKLTVKKDSNVKQTATNSTSKSIVPEKKINLTKETRNSSSTQELRIAQQQADENILTTKDDCYKTLECTLTSQQILNNGKQTERQKKNKKLIDNYQKNVPTKVNNLKALNLQRASTSNEKRMNNTHQILQLPQSSLIAKTVNKQTMIEVSKANQYFQSNNSTSKLSLSSQSLQSLRRNSLDNCKSMLKQGEDFSGSPKFINHINKSDNKTELKLRLSENGDEMLEPKEMISKKFNIDNEQQKITLELFQEQPRFERTRNVEHKFFDTIISKEDQNDFDEKKVEFVNKQTEEKDQDEFQSQVLNKLSANSVYHSKNMNLSRFISNNKSQIDFKNHYNKVEFRNLTDLFLLKGNRCQCLLPQNDDNNNNNNNNKENLVVTNSTCGDFCKKLSPQQERDIIKHLLLNEKDSFLVQEYGYNGSPSIGNFNGSGHKILAPSSRSRSPGQNVEDLNYKTQQQQSHKREEKKYLINAKWWRQWCDYVNFEASTPLKSQKNQYFDNLDDKHRENGEKRIIILNLKNVKNQILQESAIIPGSNYPKPDKINNEQEKIIKQFIYREILKEGKQTEIQDDLVEHFDFMAVSCEVWKHLYSWYSADWTIMRFMKRDKTNKKAYYLDLYPEKKSAINQYMIEQESDIYESESEFSQYNLVDASDKELKLKDLS